MSDAGGQEDGDGRLCLIVEDRPDTREWLVELVRGTFPDLRLATAGSLREARRWLAEQAGGAQLSAMAVNDEDRCSAVGRHQQCGYVDFLGMGMMIAQKIVQAIEDGD